MISMLDNIITAKYSITLNIFFEKLYLYKKKKKVTRYHFVIIFINNYYSCNIDVVLNDATHLPFPKISFRSNIRETRWITRYILGIQWFIAKSIRKRWCFLCRWYITAETADEGRPRNQRTIFFFFSFSTLITIFFRVPISQSCEMRVNAPVSTWRPVINVTWCARKFVMV